LALSALVAGVFITYKVIKRSKVNNVVEEPQYYKEEYVPRTTVITDKGSHKLGKKALKAGLILGTAKVAKRAWKKHHLKKKTSHETIGEKLKNKVLGIAEDLGFIETQIPSDEYVYEEEWEEPVSGFRNKNFKQKANTYKSRYYEEPKVTRKLKTKKVFL